MQGTRPMLDIFFLRILCEYRLGGNIYHKQGGEDEKQGAAEEKDKGRTLSLFWHFMSELWYSQPL